MSPGRRIRPWTAVRAVATVAGLATSVLGVVRLLDDETTAAVASSSPTSTPTTVPAPPPVRPATCEGEGYRLGYPADWHEDGPCRWFHPGPFDVPEFGEVAVAVSVSRVPIDFDEWVAQFDEEEVYVVLDREQTTVAGERALRVHYEYAQGGVDPGAEGYEVAVDAEGGPLTILAYEPFAGDFAVARAVVDDMADSMELT